MERGFAGARSGGLHGLGKLLEHDVGVLVLHAVEEGIHLHGHLSGDEPLAKLVARLGSARFS